MSSYLHAAAALLTALLIAQTNPSAAAAQQQPNPADAAAPSADATYRSVFADYRSPQFEQKLEWRQANDAVRDVGGHMGALKEQAPAAQASGGTHRHGDIAGDGAGHRHGGHGRMEHRQ